MDSSKKKFTKAEVEKILKDARAEYEKVSALQKERIFELKASVSELEKQLDEYRKREAQIARALTFAAQKATEIESAARKKYDLEIEHLRVFHEKWKNYYNQLLARYPLDANIAEISEFNREMTRILNDGLDSNATGMPAKQRVDVPDAAHVFDSENKRLKQTSRKLRQNTKSASRGAVKIDVLGEPEPDERFESVVKTSTRKKTPKVAEELAFYSMPEEEPSRSFIPPKNIVNYLEKEESEPTPAVAKPSELPKEPSASGTAWQQNAIGTIIPGAPIPPSESGFSFEEALNPTNDLEDIMKELGLVFDGEL